MLKPSVEIKFSTVSSTLQHGGRGSLEGLLADLSYFSAGWFENDAPFGVSFLGMFLMRNAVPRRRRSRPSYARLYVSAKGRTWGMCEAGAEMTNIVKRSGMYTRTVLEPVCLLCPTLAEAGGAFCYKSCMVYTLSPCFTQKRGWFTRFTRTLLKNERYPVF